MPGDGGILAVEQAVWSLKAKKVTVPVSDCGGTLQRVLSLEAEFWTIELSASVAARKMNEEKRRSILKEIARLTGQRVPWRFIKHTDKFIPGIERFHPLITGIYKPAGSNLALSIIIKKESPYADRDEVIYTSDGRWLMTYSPRSGGLQHSDNQALLRCMQAKEPLGVFQQISDKRDPQGSTYRVLGLGMIVNYDEGNGVFVVENVERKALAAYLSDTVEDSERSQVELYALALGRFEPHIREEQSQYLTNAPKRDQAFRRIVMEQYDYSCAVCQMKFKLDTLIEATAAHIIAKQANGTDDPRNGLGLCRLHHWAFDAGLFTLSDDLEILVSPEVRRAETHEFDLLERERSPIAVPQDDLLIPHPRAIQWHREKVWRA